MEGLTLTQAEALRVALEQYVAALAAQETQIPPLAARVRAARKALAAYSAELNGAADDDDPVLQALSRTVRIRDQELATLERAVTETWQAVAAHLPGVAVASAVAAPPLAKAAPPPPPAPAVTTAPVAAPAPPAPVEDDEEPDDVWAALLAGGTEGPFGSK